MIKIEKGKPITAIQGRGRKPLYPWAQMKIGDSFFAKVRNIGKSRFNAQIKYNAKFITRKEKGGLRVWRVK